jgi:hypothetical protein
MYRMSKAVGQRVHDDVQWGRGAVQVLTRSSQGLSPALVGSEGSPQPAILLRCSTCPAGEAQNIYASLIARTNTNRF